MSAAYLAHKGYGRRWAVVSFVSALKRTTGSTLTSRQPAQLLAEAAFKVLAYTLRRQRTNAVMDLFNRARWVLVNSESDLPSI